MGKEKEIATEYLIIGNSAGGIGAAEAIREIDKNGSLTIVSDEPYPAYSRPLISEYLAGERTVGQMLFRPADFYSQNNINLVLSNKVKSLELSQRIALMENGEQITWSKLLLATGGAPIIPRMEGMDKKGVFTFLTIEDARAISDFTDAANNVHQVVVIGGGLIGVSVTEALTKLGIGVTIVEMKNRVLNTILDEQASSIAEKCLKRSDIKIVTNHTVSEIKGKSSVTGVILDNGEEILCEMIIFAIGVLPRVELALDTEIKINRGVLVDNHMATNFPDVYSCGDVAEAYDFIYDTNRPIPLWPNAYIGGMVAGYNMASVKSEYPGGTAINSLNYFGLDIATAGMVTPPDDNDYEVITKQTDSIYQKVILNNGFVKGFIFTGNMEKSGMIFGLMRERVNISSFKQELLEDDFGLICFPQELRKERLGTSQSRVTHTSIKPIKKS